MKFHEYMRSNTKIALILMTVFVSLELLFRREGVATVLRDYGIGWSVILLSFMYFILGYVIAMFYNAPSLLFRKRYRRKVEKKAMLAKQTRVTKRTEHYIELVQPKFRALAWNHDYAIHSLAAGPSVEWTNEEAAATLTNLSPRLTTLRQDYLNEDHVRQQKEVFDRYGRLLDSGMIDVERLNAFLGQSELPKHVRQALIHPFPLVDTLEAMKARSYEINGRHLALSAGIEGEQIVMQELEKYADSYTTLYGNRIAYDAHHTVESDALVFSEQGIFTIEVKNIKAKGDQFIKISKDGVWYARRGLSEDWQVDEQSSKIFDQMNRQVYGSQKFISDQTGERLTVHPVVVIANANAKIENETDWVVIRPNQLYTVISRGKDQLSQETCESLRDLFKAHNLGQKAFKHLDYTKEYDQILQNTLFIHHVTTSLLILLSTYNEMEK